MSDNDLRNQIQKAIDLSNILQTSDKSDNFSYIVEGYCKSLNITKIYFRTNNKQIAEIVSDILSDICDNEDLTIDGEVVDSIYIINN